MSAGMKKTRSSVAALEQAEGGAGFEGSSVSTTNNSTPTRSRQMGIGGE